MTLRQSFRAAAVLAAPDRWVVDGVIAVERGRIVWVGPREQASQEGEWTDLGDVVLTPGLVNAHAHLELGALAGRCPAGGGMLGWVGAVLREKASLSSLDYAKGIEEGAKRLIETGTTTVGDVDSTFAAARGLGATGLRGRVFLELLDGRDVARTAAAAERLDHGISPGEAGRVLAGVSPHAPHTVSAELLECAVAWAHSTGTALSVHFAETSEEVEWLEAGSGPFNQLLGRSPRSSGLELLEAGGIARVPSSLVHANHVTHAELQRIAELGGALVHCPGTHEFFAREPAPLAAWREAGVTIALGTDSLASNSDLDLRREMALVSVAHPELEAQEIFRMATEGGAAALGLAGQVGVLAPGAHADFVAYDLPHRSRRDALETLVRARPRVRGVWIAGEGA